MASLSAIILTHNEAHNIEDCIKSCLFADEILVIDDNSTDNTVTIAQAVSPKVRVVNHALNSDWAQQRNFAMTLASSEYILFIDADERITDCLKKSIIEALYKKTVAQYSFKRVNNFALGKPRHGVFRPDWVIRLFPKNSGKYDRPVHERFISGLPHKKLSGEILHFTYCNWDRYWEKINTYAKVSAENYSKSKKKCSFTRDIVLRPIWAFIKVYFINLGFLDGKLGWIFSIYHAVYTTNKYVRLYSLNKHNGKI